LSIGDVSVVEGNSGTVAANFVVSLSAPSGNTVTVNYATANGTAAAPGDYTATTFGVLTFDPNTTTRTVTVTANGDALYQPDETFFVNLSGAVGATISKAQGVGTIVNHDPLPSLSFAGDVAVTEGNSGTTSASFVVNLSGASASNV